MQLCSSNSASTHEHITAFCLTLCDGSGCLSVGLRKSFFMALRYQNSLDKGLELVVKMLSILTLCKAYMNLDMDSKSFIHVF